MSSPTATASTAPYTYHTAAELATRHLVSLPSSSSTFSSSASTDSPTSTTDASSRPGLERRTTRNYEEALVATSSASSSSEPSQSEAGSKVSESSGGGGGGTGGRDRPKPLSSAGRQQSYEIRDMRRAATQSYLADGKPDAGYTSATRK